MHSAPSVSYPVGRCRFAAVLCAAVWLAGALVLAAWLAQAPGPGWRQGVAAAAAAAVAAGALLAAAAWLRGARGELCWDGGRWTWREAVPAASADGAAEQAGALRLRLDLQHWLLVAWRGEQSAARWLWLERERAPRDWDALRRAVYSRARTEGPRGQEPPPAEP